MNIHREVEHKKRTRWIIFINSLLIAGVIGFVLFQGSRDYTDDRATKELAQKIHTKLVELTGSDERSSSEIELIIRKVAHVVEYMILGTVLLTGIYAITGRWWLSLLLTLVVAVPIPFIDEFYYQSKAIGRSVQFFDIVLDEFGILISIIVGGINQVERKLSMMCSFRRF